jgi:hypothetical protein
MSVLCLVVSHTFLGTRNLEFLLMSLWSNPISYQAIHIADCSGHHWAVTCLLGSTKRRIAFFVLHTESSCDMNHILHCPNVKGELICGVLSSVFGITRSRAHHIHTLCWNWNGADSSVLTAPLLPCQQDICMVLPATTVRLS